MEKLVDNGDYGVYRCPSCEHFFYIDGWSEENDICKLCLEGIDYEPEGENHEDEDDDYCFICDSSPNCVCDERTDAYKEYWMDDE